MAQLLMKINPAGTDTWDVAETLDQVLEKMKSNIIFEVTRENNRVLVNREYVLAVHESPNTVVHNDKSQLL